MQYLPASPPTFLPSASFSFSWQNVDLPQTNTTQSQTSGQHDSYHTLNASVNQQDQSVEAPPPDQLDFADIGYGAENFTLSSAPVGESQALHLSQGRHDDVLNSQRAQDAHVPRIILSQETRINGQPEGQPQYQLGTVARDMRHDIEIHVARIFHSTRSASPTEIAETCNQLRNAERLLQEWANQPTQGQQPQTPVEQQTPPVVTGDAVTTVYKCWDCDARFRLQPTFQRHLETLHRPRYMYSCDFEDCDHRDPRRDKMRDHYSLAHTIRVTNQRLDRIKSHQACPGICPICFRLVRSWPELYRCWISHCTFPPGHNGPPGDGGDDPDNGGAGPSPGSGTRPAGRAGRRPGMGFPYPTPRGPRRGSTTQRRGQNQRSVDAQSPLVAHTNRRPTSTRGDTQLNTPSTQDGRRPSVLEIIVPRPQHGGTMRTHQPADRVQPLPREELHCRRCDHRLTGCHICCRYPVSTLAYGCHMCHDAQALRNISPTDAMGFALRGGSDQIFMGSQNDQPPGNIVETAQAAGFTQYGGPYVNPQRLNQNHHPQGGRGGPNTHFRGSNFDVGAFVVTVPEHHPDGNEIDLFNSKSSTNQLSATSRSLPIRPLLPKGLSELPQMKSLIADCMYNKSSLVLIWNLASIIFAYSNKIDDSLVKDSSPRANSPFPTSEETLLPSPVCNPSPPIHTESHKGQTYVELAPGRVLCVDMQVLPDEQERGAHPLRTRVRVLVKLLKLRSSVARAGNKKKAKEDAETDVQALCTGFNALNLGSKSVKIVDDKDESSSDVDSEADELFSDTKSEASSASEASISDQALLLNEKSDLLDDFETEFQFSVDIEVDRLSTWTDAFADLEANIEDPKINDNARVFEILFRYILYVIFGSRRFLKHGSYPKFLG
ncbi:hypothetical protein N7528_007544 [Penicillium herquei]|nr:hypothetical protein N7528_007544 [Penicillium herquei]